MSGQIHEPQVYFSIVTSSVKYILIYFKQYFDMKRYTKFPTLYHKGQLTNALGHSKPKNIELKSYSRLLDHLTGLSYRLTMIKNMSKYVLRIVLLHTSLLKEMSSRHY